MLPICYKNVSSHFENFAKLLGGHLANLNLFPGLLVWNEGAKLDCKIFSSPLPAKVSNVERTDLFFFLISFLVFYYYNNNNYYTSFFLEWIRQIIIFRVSVKFCFNNTKCLFISCEKLASAADIRTPEGKIFEDACSCSPRAIEKRTNPEKKK